MPNSPKIAISAGSRFHFPQEVNSEAEVISVTRHRVTYKNRHTEEAWMRTSHFHLLTRMAIIAVR